VELKGQRNEFQDNRGSTELGPNQKSNKRKKVRDRGPIEMGKKNGLQNEKDEVSQSKVGESGPIGRRPSAHAWREGSMTIMEQIEMKIAKRWN